MLYYFASSHSHCWGERSSGSTLKRRKNTTWALCSKNFLAKFFVMGKTNALRGKITSFQQQHDESVLEAWERFQDYILECPHHGMESWLLM